MKGFNCWQAVILPCFTARISTTFRFKSVQFSTTFRIISDGISNSPLTNYRLDYVGQCSNFPVFFNKRPMRCNSTSSNYTRQTCRTLISVCVCVCNLNHHLLQQQKNKGWYVIHLLMSLLCNDSSKLRYLTVRRILSAGFSGWFSRGIGRKFQR